MASPDEWNAARPLVAEARRHILRRFGRDRNVVGVGFGPPTRGGRRLDTPACVIYVVRKIPADQLPPDRLLPRTVDIDVNRRVETDVVETGRFYAYAYAGLARPMPSGISIGHRDITAGTLGGYVEDLSSGEIGILSNNHVLANSNSGAVGDPIFQPGPLDAARSETTRIGSLRRSIPIAFGGAPNRVDAALAFPLGTCDLVDGVMGGQMTTPTPDQPAVGLLFAGSYFNTILNPINDVTARLGVEMAAGPGARVAVSPADMVSPGTAVHKTGRTTEYTTGRIVSIDTTVTVGYGAGRLATFDGQIITTGMAAGGDSGSIVCKGGSGEVGVPPVLTACSVLHLAEDVTGIPFSQEWVSIEYARSNYLAPSLVGQWLIETFYENVNQQAHALRVQQAEVDPEDRAFAQALYAAYGSEVKLALYEPDRDDLRVTEQHLAEGEEALARLSKYLLTSEVWAAYEVFALVRTLLGLNGRSVIAKLDDPGLLQSLRDIVADLGIHDPYG